MTFQLNESSIDKWFKTRDGRKVKCVYRYSDNKVSDGIGESGYAFYCPNHFTCFHVQADGCVRSQDREWAYDRDIISIWHEPIEREVTVYLWDNGLVTLNPNSGWTIETQIASTKVKLIEGTFAQ